MRIITISRQFGSGGRELGKRMADVLGWDYYDREIITAVAREEGLDENYVDRFLESHSWRTVPVTFHNSFSGTMMQSSMPSVLLATRKVIQRLPAAGNDCIIVGRNAQVYLKDENPFKLFVIADMEARIARCRERAPENENFTDRQMRRKITDIDKDRRTMRDIIGGGAWDDPLSYHMTVNTTGRDIKKLSEAVAEFAVKHFEAEGR